MSVAVAALLVVGGLCVTTYLWALWRRERDHRINEHQLF